MNLLVFTTLWPNAEQPHFGLFVRHRIAALARQSDVNVRVVAPVPYFPKTLQARFLPASWRRAARMPARELVTGFDTYHPRFFNPPKVGMRFYGRWMAQGAEALLRRIHLEWPIDVLDAHYAYPDGEAATLLGARLGIPVVVTARGTDINLFAQLPHIRPRLAATLQRAARVIAVSQALQERMLALGVSKEKIAVIGNGVDRTVFFPRARDEARQNLGLNLPDRMLLTVASLVSLKRIDRLIDALAQLPPELDGRKTRLFVLGEGPLRPALTAQISRLNLQDRVVLLGARPQAELADWYAAADLFCLASEREGCPNVVLEALACGLPVLAADVGGVRELVPTPACGRVLTEPTAANFAVEIAAALQANWSRTAMATCAGVRSWDDVAQEVLRYYEIGGLIRRPPCAR